MSEPMSNTAVPGPGFCHVHAFTMHTHHALHTPSAPRAATHQPTVLAAEDISRIIEMAWEDRTPFESIALQFGLNEAPVITLMRRQLKPGSFRLWRQRVTGRATKHAALRSPAVSRAYCPTQYKHR